MVQIAFIALVAVIVAAVISFFVMGLMQHRRCRLLARSAHEMSMRFSRDDPFDVPYRYWGFALINSGHSPRANNVTYGRYEGWVMRAFDFRYEVGHGPRRSARNYNVIVAETELDMPAVLMWSDMDGEFAPLAARRPEGHKGGWSYRGSEAMAQMLAEACEDLAAEGLSMQTRGKVLMLHLPSRRWRQGYSTKLTAAVTVLDRLRHLAGGVESPKGQC
ncbi:MAG: hypothetical protein KAU28_05115 [Phycisphaerae bacterium]|nr:hypothetical protein [Phycisphaerae bacterium]